MGLLSDLSSGAVSGVLGSIGTLAKDLRSAITCDISPDKQAEIQQKLMEIELSAVQAQTKINEVEAANPNIFIAGWRPMCGWVGAAALLYASMLEPMLRFVCQVIFGYTGTFPEIDTTITTQILGGILGIGAMRTMEKLKK